MEEGGAVGTGRGRHRSIAKRVAFHKTYRGEKRIYIRMQIHRHKHARGYRVILHKLWQGLPFRVAALKIFHAIWNERKIESVHK